MEGKEQKKKYNRYIILCVLTAIVASFPVSCNYIMAGGIVTEWIARIEELATGFGEGKIFLFPSAEILNSTGITVNGMNSNLWFFIPGLLCRITGSVVFSYRIYMLLIQAGTLLTAALCFQRIFGDRQNRTEAYIGILLYMTNPYRIYVCYDLADFSQATAWMLLPLYVWAMYGILTARGRVKNLIVAALSLAGIGYASVILFLTLACFTLLIGLFARRAFSFVSVLLGSLLFLPGLYRLGRYLFLDGFGELNMPIQTIMKKGYHPGQYFSTYAFRDGKPGMGLGMMICLMAVCWLAFVQGKRCVDKNAKGFLGIAVFFTVLSLSCFPWDVLQRLGVWALKLVSLIDTPAIFWGVAFAALCVPAAEGIGRISRCENKLIAVGIPVTVVLFCVGVCVYQCNMLTYSRLPLM